MRLLSSMYEARGDAEAKVGLPVRPRVRRAGAADPDAPVATGGMPAGVSL
jgi:hypothetical protein